MSIRRIDRAVAGRYLPGLPGAVSLGARPPLLAATAALILAASGALAQVRVEPVEFPHPDEVIEGEGFMVVADRRVFAVMSLLNAVGYDREYEGTEMHPVRMSVRRQLEERLADHRRLVVGWRETYESLDLPVWVYLDYALSLSPDFPFRRIRPDGEFGYGEAARMVEEAGFPDLLNEFWRVAELGEVWSLVKSEYRAELERYDFGKMSAQFAALWEYLRMPRQDDYVLVNVPNLLDTHYQAIGADYGRYYYQVESPGSHAYALNLHEYLHSVVNPLVSEHFDANEDLLAAYYRAGKEGPLAASYQHPAAIAYESVVRALDHRLRAKMAESPEDVERAEARVAELTEGGLTLVGPFYQVLIEEFEPAEAPFDEMFPLLLGRLPPPGS